MPVSFKDLLSKIKESQDRKAIFSNFIYLFLLRISSYIFPLLTIPYLAKVIGANGFGKIAFAAAVIVWFQTIADWGFNYTSTRDVAKNRDDSEAVSKIFSNTFWARLLLSILSFCILIICIESIPYLEPYKLILLLTFLIVPSQALYPEWFFQAIERMKYITIFNLISKAIFTILIFTFIKTPSDYILQPIFTAAGILLSGIFSTYLIVFKWKIKVHRPKLSEILKAIKTSTDVFITNLAPNLYFGFSTILLGFIGGASPVGLLDAARKVLAISDQFLIILSRVFFPFLSRRKNKHNIYLKINLFTALLLFSVIFIGAPFIIKLLFTEEFYPAIDVLRICSFSIIFIALRDIYGLNYMIVNGHEAIQRNIIMSTSMFGFIIAFPLINLYGLIGAALTTTITHGLQGFIITIKARKLKTLDGVTQN